MTFDKELADRLRELLVAEDDVTERKMFGGLAFLVNGNMAVSASGQGGLLLRVEPADTGELVNRPNVNRFVMRGREMDGWLRVSTEAVGTKRELEQWVKHGVKYARSLPPKR